LIREDLVEPVGIPKINVGNLSDFAVLWESRQTVIGIPVSRNIDGGSLLLLDDTKMPPPELNLGPDEGAMWVPVDTRSFVPALVVPGDTVSFLVSRRISGIPTPAMPGNRGVVNPENPSADNPTGPDGRLNPEAATSNDPVEVIGPFKVLSLGNRLGSTEVMKAAKISLVQENIMTIRVKLTNGKPDPKVLYLRNRLEATNFRQVGVILHARKTK
jgi:hypothetical protein